MYIDVASIIIALILLVTLLNYGNYNYTALFLNEFMHCYISILAASLCIINLIFDFSYFAICFENIHCIMKFVRDYILDISYLHKTLSYKVFGKNIFKAVGRSRCQCVRSCGQWLPERPFSKIWSVRWCISVTLDKER